MSYTWEGIDEKTHPVLRTTKLKHLSDFPHYYPYDVLDQLTNKELTMLHNFHHAVGKDLLNQLKIST